MTMMGLLNQALDQKLLRFLDVQFAQIIAAHHSPLLQLACALLSSDAGAGHVCLPLARLAPEYFFDGRHPELAEALWQAAGKPNKNAWLNAFQSSSLVGEGTSPTPLVLEKERLYLQRMWKNEGQVIQFISDYSLEKMTYHKKDECRLKQILDQLFTSNESDINFQKVAAAVAITSKVAIISGGPGTGKTTTVAKLLTALIRLSGERTLRIELAAPTGKAAVRLTQSLGNAYRELSLSAGESRRLPEKACTLHRLLGAYSKGHQSRYHKNNPLDLDVLVVDEASMVDLPMLARLIDALPNSAQVIFLGDRDQLASVEAGSVLGEIGRFLSLGYSTSRAEELNRLTGYDLKGHPIEHFPNLCVAHVCDQLCLLNKNYRFDKKSGIGELAQAVNSGEHHKAHSILRDVNKKYVDIRQHALSDAKDYQKLLKDCVAAYQPYLELIKQGKDPETILHAFNRYQLLCALRTGSFGLEGLNTQIEKTLCHSGLLSLSQKPFNNSWYSGRPIMIECNDSSLGLFNGDLGMTLYDHSGALRVYFQFSDGHIKSVQPNRLPAHSTAYAMTVHKSQGSEFEHTALVLPDHFTPIVTRELVYTAITRARQKLTLYSTDKVLNHAILNPTQRRSGLVARLKSF